MSCSHPTHHLYNYHTCVLLDSVYLRRLAFTRQLPPSSCGIAGSIFGTAAHGTHHTNPHLTDTHLVMQMLAAPLARVRDHLWRLAFACQLPHRHHAVVQDGVLLLGRERGAGGGGHFVEAAWHSRCGGPHIAAALFQAAVRSTALVAVVGAQLQALVARVW